MPIEIDHPSYHHAWSCQRFRLRTARRRPSDRCDFPRRPEFRAHCILHRRCALRHRDQLIAAGEFGARAEWVFVHVRHRLASCSSPQIARPNGLQRSHERLLANPSTRSRLPAGPASLLRGIPKGPWSPALRSDRNACRATPPPPFGRGRADASGTSIRR